LKVAWNINQITDFYLWRVSTGGNHLESLYRYKWVSNGGSFKVDNRKLKPGSRYKIQVRYFPNLGTFTVPVDDKSYLEIVMLTESYFNTVPLLVRPKR